MPMYAVHSDGYSTVPIQPGYAMNGGDAYGQGVVNHVRPHGPPGHAHGGGGLDGGPMGDQKLMPQHMPAMGSPPQPSMPAPQQVYMSAQGTYMVAGGDDGRSNGVSSAAGAAGGSGGAANMQPMLVYQQGGNAQQGQQGPGADQAASQMFLPMSQAGYGYVPQMSHLQAGGGGGVPVYQMAGAALDGGAQPSTRSNGVVSGGGGSGSGGGGGGGNSNGGNGRTSPGSPTLASPQSGAPPPQSFQVRLPTVVLFIAVIDRLFWVVDYCSSSSCVPHVSTYV